MRSEKRAGRPNYPAAPEIEIQYPRKYGGSAPPLQVNLSHASSDPYHESLHAIYVLSRYRMNASAKKNGAANSMPYVRNVPERG